MKTPSVKSLRCAIYTRVSTEQGLDQEFNSLDAQYDAASAYIRRASLEATAGIAPDQAALLKHPYAFANGRAIDAELPSQF